MKKLALLLLATSLFSVPTIVEAGNRVLPPAPVSTPPPAPVPVVSQL